VAGTGQARADAPATARVLRNLLDNAVRHARSRVDVAVAGGRVTVDDDGSGIPPDARDVVFERFVRLDEARERDAGGSGLGLAIARELAREMHGDVTLDEAPGGGLRAVLELPG
jgi:signal transduction histidine kinase